MSQGFFDNLIQWEFTRNGTTRTLPYLYYDVRSLAAIYTAKSSKIKALLPSQDMRPVELIPGRCLVAFACFEYRKTDGPPYNEVSISFLITYKKRQIPGLTSARMLLSRATESYVWQLPVTTEQARAGGVDLFSYPKFIADIEFENDGEWITCILADKGQEVLRMSGKNLKTKRGKITRYITYAVENSTPLMAEIWVNPIEYAEAYGGSAVQLQIGTGHPICETLEHVGISKQALAFQYSPYNQAILFPARNI